MIYLYYSGKLRIPYLKNTHEKLLNLNQVGGRKMASHVQRYKG